MNNEKVIEALKVTLADSYVLYLKTQNYHWRHLPQKLCLNSNFV